MTKQRKDYGDVNGIDDFRASEEQLDLGSVIRHSDIVFVHGKAGSGKTSGVLYEFVKQYLNDVNKQIVVIATPAEVGFDPIGFLKGDEADKIGPYFTNTKDMLEKFLSVNKVKADIGRRIKFQIPNFMAGSTLDDSLIIVTEAQQMHPQVIKMILERVGQNSTVVVEGDATQLYTAKGHRAGLTHATELFKKYPTEGVDFFSFSNNHNMRSEVVNRVNKVYELDEQKEN